MKNRIGLIALLLSMVFLSGCGGSSSSSTTETTTSTEKPEATQTSNTCKSSGNTVLVPEGTQCTYSIAVLNGGAPQTYSCINNKIVSNGITSTSLTFNETTFICE